MAMPLAGFLRERYWVRTSALFGVKHARCPADVPVIVTQLVTQHFVPNSARERHRRSFERGWLTVDTPAPAEQHGCCCTSLLYSRLSATHRRPSTSRGNAWARDASRLDQSCSRLPWPRREGFKSVLSSTGSPRVRRRRHRRLFPPFGLDCDVERAWSGARHRRNRGGAIRHLASRSAAGVCTR
jgi:hypothetical protein